MKINIEDYLQKIDASFKEKEPKEIYMTYIMIFALIFAFAYLLYWDTSEADFKAKRAQVVATESKIITDERFLKLNPISQVVKIEQETKNAQIETVTYKENNEYIKKKIEEISSLIYDERTWGEYLHSISINAKKYNVKILDINNKFADNNKSFGHLLDINVQTEGKYSNTINFINSLEQSELVVDLHDFNISSMKKNIHGDFNISVWGITY